MFLIDTDTAAEKVVLPIKKIFFSGSVSKTMPVRCLIEKRAIEGRSFRTYSGLPQGQKRAASATVQADVRVCDVDCLALLQIHRRG